MSENNLPAIGTYKAYRPAPIYVKPASTGALAVQIPYALIGSNPPFQGEHQHILYKADGTEMLSNIQKLAEIFPAWKPDEEGRMNPFKLAEIPLAQEGEAEFELSDCFHHEYNGKIYFKAQWLNALAKSKSDPKQEAELMAIWGDKFKQSAIRLAAMSKTPAAKPTPAPAVVAEPVQESAPKAKPERKKAEKVVAAKVVYETAEQLYDALIKLHPNMDADSLANNIYYPACDELFGANNMPANADDLAKLAEKLGL